MYKKFQGDVFKQINRQAHVPLSFKAKISHLSHSLWKSPLHTPERKENEKE